MADMNAELDVLSFGESLVDFLPDSRGTPLADVDHFRKVVGGAPTNMALGLARLGCRAGLLGKIGDDAFGDFVVDELRRQGVDLAGIARTDRAKTGLTFVTLDERGDRSFLFYRDTSADMLLEPADIEPELFERARIFQLGSNLLTASPVREATERALDSARRASCLISFDPNVRIDLWPSPAEARRAVLDVVSHADIVKLNEEELELVAETPDAERAWDEVFAPRDVRALAVTRDAAGADLFRPDAAISMEAPTVDVVDTTGAGDGFVSGLLAGLSTGMERTEGTGLEQLSRHRWERSLALACHVGSLVCTEFGATPGLPEAESLPERFRDALA